MISEYQKNAHQSWAKATEEKENFPEEFRTVGEQYLGRKPEYWPNYASGKVRVFITDLRGKRVSKFCEISREQWESRPKADRRTKAEAIWAFDLCAFRP